jgi:hypothetical protein
VLGNGNGEDVGGQCDSCTGTGTGGHEVENDGPV